MTTLKSILDKTKTYSVPILLLASLICNELSYNRVKLSLRSRDKAYNVFERGDKIIFRDTSGGPSIMYLDLIGNAKGKFLSARQQAPIRGVGNVQYKPNHPRWRNFENRYAALFRQYRRQYR